MFYISISIILPFVVGRRTIKHFGHLHQRRQLRLSRSYGSSAFAPTIDVKMGGPVWDKLFDVSNKIVLVTGGSRGKACMLSEVAGETDNT